MQLLSTASLQDFEMLKAQKARAEADYSHLHVTFYSDGIKDEQATREKGEPVYKDVEMVRIQYAGDNKRELYALAHEKFKQGADGDHVTYAQFFADEYKAFKESENEPLFGTPLSAIPFLSEVHRAKLLEMNVKTAEAIVSMNNTSVQNFGMHGRDLQDAVKSWLEENSATAALSKANAEKEALQRQIDQINARLNNEDPSGWSEDKLRSFLEERGVKPRANATKDKLVEAVQTFMNEDAA